MRIFTLLLTMLVFISGIPVTKADVVTPTDDQGSVLNTTFADGKFPAGTVVENESWTIENPIHKKQGHHSYLS